MKTKDIIDIILDAAFPWIFAGMPDDKLHEYLQEELSEDHYKVYLENKEEIHKILKIK